MGGRCVDGGEGGRESERKRSDESNTYKDTDMVSDTSSMVTRGALLAALDIARCPFCVHGEEERQDPAETHSTVPVVGTEHNFSVQPRTLAKLRVASVLMQRAEVHLCAQRAEVQLMLRAVSAPRYTHAEFCKTIHPAHSTYQQDVSSCVCVRACAVYTLAKLRVALAVALHVASSCSLRVPILSPSHARTHASARTKRTHPHNARKIHSLADTKLRTRPHTHTSPRHSCPGSLLPVPGAFITKSSWAVLASAK